MKARIGFFLTAVAVIVVVGACTPDGGSIYWTIEGEKRVSDDSLPNSLTVTDIVRAGSAYYVSAGAIYMRTLSGETVTWKPSTSETDRPYNLTDASGAYALCNALAIYPGPAGTDTLWAGFITVGGTLGLHESNPGPFDAAWAAGWTADPGPALTDEQVIGLRVANGHLFMVGARLSGSAYVYDLLWKDTSAAAWATLATGLSDPIVGVAWDGTNYWMASGINVYSAADPLSSGSFGSGTSTLGTTTIASDDEISDVFADATNDRVFVTTKKGGIYFSNAAAWAQVAAPVINAVTVSLLTIVGPVDAGNTRYLVGAEGYGYYTLDATTSELTRFADATIPLYTSSVGRILVEGTTVFMGTHGNGLWRATFDGTGAPAAGGAWAHE